MGSHDNTRKKEKKKQETLIVTLCLRHETIMGTQIKDPNRKNAVYKKGGKWAPEEEEGWGFNSSCAIPSKYIYIFYIFLYFSPFSRRNKSLHIFALSIITVKHVTARPLTPPYHDSTAHNFVGCSTCCKVYYIPRENTGKTTRPRAPPVHGRASMFLLVRRSSKYPFPVPFHH